MYTSSNFLRYISLFWGESIQGNKYLVHVLQNPGHNEFGHNAQLSNYIFPFHKTTHSSTVAA